MFISVYSLFKMYVFSSKEKTRFAPEEKQFFFIKSQGRAQL